uniref:Uncharacterized protein n=1 Tax=Pseudomonas phage PaBG TaxID=1335230 RepID=S5VME5_9CAUD
MKKKKRTDDRKAKLATLSEEEPKKRKKKRALDEDELPKKKKLKQATLSTEEKRAKKKDKLEREPATSKQLAKMERRKAKLLDDLETLPVPSDHGDEFDHQYRGMFDNLRTITALFEEKMLSNPTGRDVYALSTLYSQMREVIADIRSAKDVTSQIHELESKAYSSFLTMVGQTYIDTFFKMQKDIRMYVKDTDAQSQLIASLQGVCKDQADKIQIGYGAMLDRVRTVLM